VEAAVGEGATVYTARVAGISALGFSRHDGIGADASYAEPRRLEAAGLMRETPDQIDGVALERRDGD